MGGVKRKYEEVLEEGRGPRVPRAKFSMGQGFKGARVPRSQSPKDHPISNSQSNTSLTLKKVYLVFFSKTKTKNIQMDHEKNVKTIKKNPDTSQVRSRLVQVKVQVSVQVHNKLKIEVSDS